MVAHAFLAHRQEDLRSVALQVVPCHARVDRTMTGLANTAKSGLAKMAGNAKVVSL